MMQHPGTNDQVELVVQVCGVLDRQLSRFEIRQVVLPFQSRSVFETCQADVNAGDACSRMAERELCSLPRSTSSHENIQIRAVFLLRPQQMELGAMDILVLPQVTRTIKI